MDRDFMTTLYIILLPPIRGCQIDKVYYKHFVILLIICESKLIWAYEMVGICLKKLKLNCKLEKVYCKWVNFDKDDSLICKSNI